MSDLPDPPLDQTEREMLGLGHGGLYNYRCSRCRHEDAMPDVVIDGVPRLVCPVCGGPFRPVGAGRRGRRRR